MTLFGVVQLALAMILTVAAFKARSREVGESLRADAAEELCEALCDPDDPDLHVRRLLEKEENLSFLCAWKANSWLRRRRAPR